MTKPSISILIASYNAAPFISTALASIAKQTVREWELIVVEDGSSDGTEDIVIMFAREHSFQHVAYVNLGAHQGVSMVRNRLLDLSSGDFVAFLDADDVWEPGHLASLLHCLCKGHSIGCTPVTLWDAKAGRPLGVKSPTARQISNPRAGLFRESFIQTSSCVLLSRETIKRTGYFDVSLRIGEDRDYWFRALDGGATLGCPTEPTCRYVKHDGNSMTKTLLVAQQAVAFYEKHRETSAVSVAAALYYHAGALRTLGRLTRYEKPDEARRIFLRAWKMWPLGVDLPLRALAAGL